MRGWIYIFSNRSMKGLIKIGYTDRDPAIRVAEQHSGLPHPHDIEYELFVENAYLFEQKVHKKLQPYHESKEWFRIEVSSAVKVIREMIGSKIILENYVKATKEEVEKSIAIEIANEEELHKKEIEKRKKLRELKQKKEELNQEYKDRLKQEEPEHIQDEPINYLYYLLGIGIVTFLSIQSYILALLAIPMWLYFYFGKSNKKIEINKEIRNHNEKVQNEYNSKLARIEEEIRSL